MLIWSILIALAGAFCMALGSALQERDAVRAPGHSVARFGFLLHLAQRPRWLLGTLGAGAGVVLHLVALSGAPLTIIQPIGVTGLIFAIVLSAVFNRRRVRPGQIVAGGAVMVGLAGLLLLFPHTAQTPHMATGTALALAGSVAAVGCAAYAAAHWLPPALRVLLLAAVGGVALGTTSALARVVAANAVVDATAVLSWLTVLCVAVAVFGGLFQQNAYRTGHFAAAYATLLVVDPITGAGIGALLLGEGLPATPLDQALAAGSALLAIAGTVALAVARNRNPEAARHRTGDPAPAGTALSTTSVHSTTTPGDSR
ncbi:DMT family transporter [Streptomonospora nanhaiensis]|uniref:Drug/metabolite transporter (DMT)-like permease n=1 Tax=Streptomonospora nanhaiensis TaxID=1323731 RepID=A0A853BM31_9ACTN|nr:DMT family transporter [Streptomonospora nanhaiensis]MBV2363203.1 DMT family transporter [Streptomonospora nanhaiensis]NYI95562.1 drug/metabolite transporter (DMT)-like permease [Streptomonospora nanhaiensis]